MLASDILENVSEKLMTSAHKYHDPCLKFLQKLVQTPSVNGKEAIKLNKEIFGPTPTLAGSGPANEGYMLVSHGIPTIMGYGPVGDNFHSANEYIELGSIDSSLQFLTRLAEE